MPKLFISYRREDSSGYAGRLNEKLSQVFGGKNVFMDLEDIEAGMVDQAIRNSVSATNVAVKLLDVRRSRVSLEFRLRADEVFTAPLYLMSR